MRAIVFTETHCPGRMTEILGGRGHLSRLFVGPGSTAKPEGLVGARRSPECGHECRSTRAVLILVLIHRSAASFRPARGHRGARSLCTIDRLACTSAPCSTSEEPDRGPAAINTGYEDGEPCQTKCRRQRDQHRAQTDQEHRDGFDHGRILPTHLIARRVPTPNDAEEARRDLSADPTYQPVRPGVPGQALPEPTILPLARKEVLIG